MKLSLKQLMHLRRVARTRQIDLTSKSGRVKALRLAPLGEMVRRYVR